MTALEFHVTAQVAIERMLNSLPEGVLIAFFAWAVLCVLRNQNARSRFAVWFLALAAIAILPFVGGLPAWSKLETLRLLPETSISAISLPAHWAMFIFPVWVLLASVPVARLIAGLFHLHRLRSRCVPLNESDLDSSLRETIDQLNSENSVWFRPVTLATSEQVRVPAALGLWKPMIVLPAWALEQLTPAELAIILRHEFAHVRRWDDWTNLIQKVVRAVFFFHPAVWWIENRLSVEREMACDDVVVAETDNPTGYASCLVSLLERSLAQRRWTMAQAIVHRAREASLRLAQILDRNRSVSTRLSKPALCLVGVFTLLCVAAAPSAPELVAFDRPVSSLTYAAAREGSPIVPRSYIHQASMHSPDIAATSVKRVPAAVHTDDLSRAPKNSKLIDAQSSSPAPRRASPERAVDSSIVEGLIATNFDMTPELPAAASDAAVEMVAMSGHDFQYPMRTLVLVQATQVGPNAVLWNVRVWKIPTTGNWRMTVIAPLWQQPARVATANSI
jgi:beta-lactamase regulating signal transducer with metallopeptidase domain